MRRFHFVMILGAAAATSTAACKKDVQKLSPDDLIVALSSSGAVIKKDGSWGNQPPAEMNMKLLVDDTDGMTATRFPAVELARDYCQTQPACFNLDYWAVATYASRAHTSAWAKLLAVAGKVETPIEPATSAPPATAATSPKTTATSVANATPSAPTTFTLGSVAGSPADCEALTACCMPTDAPAMVAAACSAIPLGAAFPDCSRNLKAVREMYKSSHVAPSSNCAAGATMPR
jgi:hypothetical protein